MLSASDFRACNQKFVTHSSVRKSFKILSTIHKKAIDAKENAWQQLMRVWRLLAKKSIQQNNDAISHRWLTAQVVLLTIFAQCILIVGRRRETPSNINVIYRPIHGWKVHLVGNNSVADSTSLSSFVHPLLPPKYAKSSEIPRKLNSNIAVRGHPKSSILAPIERTYATSFVLTLQCISYRFRDTDA